MTIDQIYQRLLNLSETHGTNPFYTKRYAAYYLKFVNLSIEIEKYSENHHIFPKSIFPDIQNEKWNLVKLTPRQHMIAHRILFNMFNRIGPMQSAFWFMINSRGGKISSKEYDKLKTEIAHKSSVQMHKNMIGKCTYRTTDGKYLKLPVDDPLVIELNLIPSTSGFSSYKDEGGNVYRLPVNSELIDKLKLSGVSKGKKAPDDFKSHLKGSIIAKNQLTGEIKILKIGCDELQSGEWESIHNKTTIIIQDGRKKKISLADYNNKIHDHINKNKVTCYDPVSAKNIQVSINDLRYISGELRSLSSTNTNAINALRRHAENHNQNCKGKIWVTSPANKEVQIAPNELIDYLKIGYITGRKSTKFHTNARPIGSKTINNGIIEKVLNQNESIPEGFIIGRLPRAWVCNKDNQIKQINRSKLSQYLNDGWKIGRKWG